MAINLTATQNKLKKAGIEVIDIIPSSTGYCMSCKKTVPITDVHDSILKNKLRVHIGKCSICGTEVFKTRR